MVILEARTLGLPVITTSFSSVGDSVPPDAGIVVPKTVEGMVDGLERFVAGEVPSGRFDFHAYNAEAVAQFAGRSGPTRSADLPERQQVVHRAVGRVAVVPRAEALAEAGASRCVGVVGQQRRDHVVGRGHHRSR